MEVEVVRNLATSEAEQRQEREEIAFSTMGRMHLMIQEELQNFDIDYLFISSSTEFYYYSIIKICHGEFDILTGLFFLTCWFDSHCRFLEAKKHCEKRLFNVLCSL
jgi:hypothetical protein